jgi:hypothetical protein
MATATPLVTHYIQPRFALARLTKEDEIFSLIVTLVKKIAPLVTDPKLPDLLEYVANLVENFVNDRDKIGRDDLIVKIYRELFPDISEADVAHLMTSLRYLRDNRLVKRIPFYKRWWYYTSNFFFHQFIDS